MVLPIVLLIAGLAILVAGAEYMVRGAASMARKWGMPAIVIGLTIVAFGTSTPELVVNLYSTFKGSTDIAIANVVGSNMANILLILGICAVIRALRVKEGTTWKEIPFALLAIVLVFLMGNDGLLDGASANTLTRADGLSLIAFFIIFLYYTYGLSKVQGEPEETKMYGWSKSILMFIGGLAGLIIGGKFIVDNAVLLATLAGLSENLIGLTIVAVGTSLPELATSVIATMRGHDDIAIGNVVGSNIFNVFWILGITAVIKPLPFNLQANTDVLFTTLATALLFVFMFIGRKHELQRSQGIFFIIMYVAYIGYAAIR